MKKVFFFMVLCLINMPITANSVYEKGKQLSTQCIACHQPNGQPINPIWPNISGQYAKYIVKQLKDFKSSQRSSEVMMPLVQHLSEQEMQALAVFYSQQPRVIGKAANQQVKLGETLYRGGNIQKHIAACIACHGPQGLGNEQANFPILSGQYPAYTVATLKDFKALKRKNDLNGIMRDISHAMSDEEMQAVAQYVYGLH